MKKEYDFSKAKRGAVIPQPSKTRITIYLDNDLLETFRDRADAVGRGYQTMINEALRRVPRPLRRSRGRGDDPADRSRRTAEDRVKLAASGGQPRRGAALPSSLKGA